MHINDNRQQISNINNINDISRKASGCAFEGASRPESPLFIRNSARACGTVCCSYLKHQVFMLYLFCYFLANALLLTYHNYKPNDGILELLHNYARTRHVTECTSPSPEE